MHVSVRFADSVSVYAESIKKYRTEELLSGFFCFYTLYGIESGIKMSGQL